MADGALLEIAGLTAGYGGGTVLHGLNLRVGPGEPVAVMGRNGVGKTTLLKTVMGLLRPRGGTVRFEGERIDGLPPFRVARAGIAYVPQGREVFADLTVEENLILGDLMAADAGRGYELFPALAERRREPAGRLSGGQQQQLAIARALVTRPRLLILDEPTEGIQPSIIKDIGNAIRFLRSTGEMAILLVEQYLEFAQELADTVFVLDRGRVVASGDPRGALGAELERHMAV